MRRIANTIRGIVRKFGYDIIRYPPTKPLISRTAKILKNHNITVVLDVGANIGQYAKKLRAIKFGGRIISFEPLSSAYKELKDNAQNDKYWETHNLALGAMNGTTLINIAGNSFSSSLLDMLPSHVKSAPESRYVGQEEIEIASLDSMFSFLCSPTDKVFLKIDTQGYEKKVIEGAKKSLKLIDFIQLEMSLVPLYNGELLFDEMRVLLNRAGYCLISIDPGFTDQDTGHVLQVDGIFQRL